MEAWAAYLAGKRRHETRRPNRSAEAPAHDRLPVMSQPTLWGHASRVPGRGWRGAVPPLTPQRQRHILGAGRDVWVKIRASEVERAAWHAKARSAGLTLSDLVRRSGGRGSCVLAGT